jgi:hypothetical protein
MTLDEQNESLYSLYRRGMELLEDGDFEEATVPPQGGGAAGPEKSSVQVPVAPSSGRGTTPKRRPSSRPWLKPTQ